jgi:hypothetical protein
MLWTPRPYGQAFALYTNPEAPDDAEQRIELPISGDAQNEAGEIYATVLNAANARHIDAAAVPGFVGIYLVDDQDDEDEAEEEQGDELDD